MESIIIYKIYHKEKPELLYIGSTFNFKNRMSSHKVNINNNNNKLKLYETIRTNGGEDKFNFEKIVELSTSSNEASKLKLVLESYYFKTLKPTMNKNHPFRTQAEYYKDNIIKITQYKTQKIICECGGKYRIDNRVHHLKTHKHIHFMNNKPQI